MKTFLDADGVECVDIDELGKLLGVERVSLSEYIDACRCRKCGFDTYNLGEGIRPCRFGNCTEWYCLGCGYSSSGMGPIGCPCEYPDSNQLKIDRAMRIRKRRADRRLRREMA